MTIELEPVESGDRPGRRRSVVAVIGAAMLVTAAGGVGFGIGRAIDDGEPSTGAATETPPATEVPADEPQTSELPTATAPRPMSSATSDPADDETDADSEPADDETAGDSAVAFEDSALAGERDIAAPAAGGPGWSIFGERPLELLAQRTTRSGITLRAHRTERFMFADEHPPIGEESWRPPAWCSPNAELRIALGGGAATGTPVLDVGSVSWWDEPFQGRAVSWLTLGVVDGNPHRVIVVQVPAGTTSVTAAFDDGNVDRAVPENGVALLVAPGGTPYDPVVGLVPPGVELSFDGPDPTMIRAEDATTWDDPAFNESCTPPPPDLPEPGEQPANPAAAEASIRDTVAAVYGGGEPGDSTDLIDDPTGVPEARAQVQEGEFADAADGAIAVIEELVFTAPTEAIYRYRLETDNGVFGDRFGAAVLVDGTWKVTRATVCLDLGLAGGDCGGPVTPVWPPMDVLLPVEPSEAPAATVRTDG